MADRTAVVLRVRRALERRAKAQTARAETELHEAVEAARERARIHDQRETGGGALTPLQLRALQIQGMASWTSVAEASVAADRARQLRDERRDAQRRAAIDRRATERMLERRQDEAAVVAAATAQRVLDDLSVARWRRA